MTQSRDFEFGAFLLLDTAVLLDCGYVDPKKVYVKIHDRRNFEIYEQKIIAPTFIHSPKKGKNRIGNITFSFDT